MIFILTPSPEAPITVPTSKPSIAVFYFDNLSEDPSLDWLRLGLADMLITDLSQSPDLEVLSTRSLYTILEEMNSLEHPITSLDVIQEVAQRTECQTAVLGSFMKAGDQYRINVQVQDLSSGRLLATKKVEGVGESSVFSMVDELTQGIKSSLEIPTATADETGFDRGIEQVTTSSLEAYRYHIEGRKLHLYGRIREAQALCEKAVETDPHFALALNGLAQTHFLLGDRARSKEYKRLAFENADRLTPRERFYIEAGYYDEQETSGLAIQAYENMLEVDPRHFAGRNDLALKYIFLERCHEAVEHLEWLRKREYPFGVVPGGLPICYGQQEKFDHADQVIQEYLKRNPNRAGYHFDLGVHLMRWGRLDEAFEAHRKAEILNPLSHYPHFGLWLLFNLREEWEQAEKEAKWLAGREGERFKMNGANSSAKTWLYSGRARDGLRVLEQSVPSLKVDVHRGFLQFTALQRVFFVMKDGVIIRHDP